MKTFLLKLTFFLPLVLLILCVEMVEDPAHVLRGDEYAKGIATHLLKGENVAGTVNFDERLLQKYYIEGLTKSSDIIVLGSSRSMQIHSQFFPDKTLFNHSVPIACLEDFIAIEELYHERHLHPSLVIIELDPWLFNRNAKSSLWKSLQSEYNSGARRLGLPTDSSSMDLRFAQLSGLFSPTNIQESFRYVIAGLTSSRHRGAYYNTRERLIDNDQIILTDGSVIPPQNQRIGESAHAHEDALTWPDRLYAGGFRGFSKIDLECARQLESFVNSLQAEEIQIAFFLTPFHSEAYQSMMSDSRGKILDEVQKYLKDLAGRKNITLIGSYNPNECSCTEDEFIDATHPDESCMEKIVQSSVLVAKR